MNITRNFYGRIIKISINKKESVQGLGMIKLFISFGKIMI
jgi:hypothetical protein